MKRIIGLLILVIAITGLWSGTWLFFAQQVDKQIAGLAVPTPGAPTITCGNKTITGWPFRFDVRCTQMTLVDSDVTIGVAEVRATALVYRPTHFLAFADSPAKLTDAFFGTEQEARWSKMEASLRTNGWRLARFSLHAEDLVYADTLLGDNERARLPIAEVHLIDMPDEIEEPGLMRVGAFARVSDATIPAYDIEAGELTFEAEATSVPDDIRFWGAADILNQWQRNNGELKITRFETSDPKTSLTLDGNLSLSVAGEAEGDMTVLSSGLSERFGDALSPQMRSLILGNAQDDNSYRQLLTIRRGAVFAGLTPLATIPPLF